MSVYWRRPLRPLALVAVAVLAAACAETYPQTIFEPVTDLGIRVTDLFAGIFWWTMLVLVVVEVALVYIIIRYRDRPGAEPRKIYGNNVAEIAWTLGPALIVVIILVPTVRTIFYTYEPGPEDSLVVEAVGHQWWWEFRYPELGVVTANQLHLPVDRPVEVRLSSADVVHNWWVPAFGGKRYNYPLTARAEGESEPSLYSVLRFTVQEPGEYSGQCAEFCGASHAIMRMRVIAQEQPEFEAWLRAMRDTAAAVPPGAALPGQAAPAATPVPEPVAAAAADAQESLRARGYQLFLQSGCAACHTIAGTPYVGRIGPNLTRFGTRWSIGAGLMDNTEENLARWIRDAPGLKPEAKMLAFPNLSEDEIQALVAYLSGLE